MALGKLLLFGPTSLKPRAIPTKKTLGKLWKLKTTPPGLIAFLCVFVRFLFSEDKEFRSTGTSSGIKYEADFHSYKRLIISKIDSEHTKKLLQLWDAYLFGKPSPDGRSGKAAAAGSEEDDEVAAALADLSDGPTDDDKVPTETQPCSQVPDTIPASPDPSSPVTVVLDQPKSLEPAVQPYVGDVPFASAPASAPAPDATTHVDQAVPIQALKARRSGHNLGSSSKSDTGSEPRGSTEVQVCARTTKPRGGAHGAAKKKAAAREVVNLEDIEDDEDSN
ncbi:hypothetical protein PM082_008381 [Marasmius tenuissimus]|nr:hypothetical protein PM082_008381 [Marasmius tenuissimus]